MSSYYDIDTILAEEELIPSTALFDFSHLAYLDPDARHRESHLPEGSQIKMPLWALERWSALGYVRMSLPRHFARKARERLEADPGDADLRYVRDSTCTVSNGQCRRVLEYSTGIPNLIRTLSLFL
jgi:hypothetical protein